MLTTITGARAHRDAPLLPPGLVLAAAVFAIRWAGPLVRFTTAPALVVAAWRLLFSVVAIAVVLTARRRWGDVLRLGRRDSPSP